MTLDKIIQVKNIDICKSSNGYYIFVPAQYIHKNKIGKMKFFIATQLEYAFEIINKIKPSSAVFADIIKHYNIYVPKVVDIPEEIKEYAKLRELLVDAYNIYCAIDLINKKSQESM